MTNNKKLWFSWLLLAMFFLGHYFFRYTPAYINLKLMKSFSISAKHIGYLTSCFFIPYALVQIPVGYCISRFSTKKLITLAAFMCSIATLLFSKSTTYLMLCASTVFFACFAAFGFIGAVTFANTQLPVQYRSLAVGLTQALGLLGGIFAMNLITNYSHLYTWQEMTSMMGWGMLGLFAIIGILVPATPAPQPIAQHIGDEKEESIFTQKKTWFNAFYAGFSYLPLSVLTESFGPPLLSSIHNLPPSTISIALSLCLVGWIIGGPISGMLADKYGRLPIMKISALFGIVLTAVIMFVPMSALGLKAALFLFGLTNTGVVACYSTAAEMYGPSKAGISVAISNMATILVASITVPFLGYLLDLWSVPTFFEDTPIYHAIDFQKAFGIVLLAPVLGYICTLFTPETKPRVK
jgi:MFS family permease